MSRVHPGTIQGAFRVYSGLIQGLRVYSGFFQGSGAYSRVIQIFIQVLFRDGGFIQGRFGAYSGVYSVLEGASWRSSSMSLRVAYRRVLSN